MRFGLLGTGPWAAETQGAALGGHSEVEFVGVWGRTSEKARSVAERYDARPYDDVDALFADVDAVAVALPPDIQAELAVRAASARCHLLLDKPLALTVPAADRVVAAVEKANVASIVFFTNRFYSTVENFIAEAATRHWDGARVTMFASIFQPGNPYGASPWRREHGGLWDIGPHALSVVLPVLGPVAAVAAMSGPHDTSYLLLRHESGAVSTLALTLDAPPDAMAHEFLFLGPSGPVQVPPGDASPVTGFRAAIDQLVSLVNAGETTHPCDVRFGREVVAILAKAESVRV
jgi:predicted dehydrogenase